jgi:acetyl esterase/lipase
MALISPWGDRITDRRYNIMLRLISLLLCACLQLGAIGFAQDAPIGRENPQERLIWQFEMSAPRIGDPLPEVTIYDAEGNPVELRSFVRGHYTVLVFGCLTCPIFRRKIPAMEAIYRDYAPKGVRFYYIYKSLAHPESYGYVRPFTLQERLAHIKEAKRTLGTEIPWLCDTMSNDLKHALGDAPNSEFVIDPKGKVVRRRAWSDPKQLRKDLEELVGPVPNPTRVSDLNLRRVSPPRHPPRTVVPPIKVPSRMRPLKIEPKPSETPYYAKLRAEVDERFLRSGRGKLYIRFHLDPLYNVHWNNLAGPLRFELKPPSGVIISPTSGEGPEVKVDTDADPREFLLDIDRGDGKGAIDLTVRYFVCGDEGGWCLAVTQGYLIYMDLDPDGSWVETRYRVAQPGRGGDLISGIKTVPAPIYKNVRYGPHERNVLDFWKAKSEEPTPLALFIHGGGFTGGSKDAIKPTVLRDLLNAGISVTAIEYRLTSDAPLPAAHLDCRRALQFLRYKAKEWNIDKTRVGAFGGSAGAQICMYLAFHDDMADPNSPDPVERESTRLTCVAVSGAQTTMDVDWWRKHIPGYREPHRDFMATFGAKTKEEYLRKVAQVSALSLISKDDPPIFMTYGMAPDAPVPSDPRKARGWKVHHVAFGVALKEKADSLGVEAHLRYPGAHTLYRSLTDFLISKLSNR